MGIIDFSDLDLKRGPLADADMLVGNNALNGISDPHLILSGAVNLKHNLSRLEGTLCKTGCIGLVLNDRNRPTPTALILDHIWDCLLYTSDAADDLLCVDLGGRRIIKKK